jgi:hypothetical protein
MLVHRSKVSALLAASAATVFACSSGSSTPSGGGDGGSSSSSGGSSLGQQLVVERGLVDVQQRRGWLHDGTARVRRSAARPARSASRTRSATRRARRVARRVATARPRRLPARPRPTQAAARWGPYICVPNDGQAYHGCVGANVLCTGLSCCVADSKGNEFCAEECTNNAGCGAAHCDMFDFSHSTCQGPLACGI